MSELRQFLIGGGLLDEGETLSQSLDRLEQMCTEALQEPSATSTAMEGERFIFSTVQHGLPTFQICSVTVISILVPP